jgi:hypothetical protein
MAVNSWFFPVSALDLARSPVCPKTEPNPAVIYTRTLGAMFALGIPHLAPGVSHRADAKMFCDAISSQLIYEKIAEVHVGSWTQLIYRSLLNATD